MQNQTFSPMEIATCTSPPTTKNQRCMVENTTCSSKNLASPGMKKTCSPSSSCRESLTTRKRKVRFAPPTFHEYVRDFCDGEQEQELPQHQQQEQKQQRQDLLWWNRNDFDSIMTKAHDIARETRHQPIVVGGLDQSLQLAVRMASLMGGGSHCHVEEHLHKMQDEHRGLKLWCQHHGGHHSRRGLEKYTSRQYNELRRKQLHKLYKRVVTLSKEGADPEQIRKVAERTSRLFVIFARMLAIADYKASQSCSSSQEKDQQQQQPPQQKSVKSTNVVVTTVAKSIPYPLTATLPKTQRTVAPVDRVRMECSP